jgi:hypothetical protein
MLGTVVALIRGKRRRENKGNDNTKKYSYNCRLDTDTLLTWSEVGVMVRRPNLRLRDSECPFYFPS